MPFRSEAQRRWAAIQVEQGKWTQAQFDEWNSVTPARIPERLHPKKERSLKAPLKEVASYTKKRFGQ